MKVLLLFPPQWMPVSPHFAIPALAGQLKGAGYDVEILDLNVDFYNKILTRSNVQNSLNVAKDMLPVLKEEISSKAVKGKAFSDYSFEFQNKIAKASIINDFLNKYKNEIPRTTILIEKAVEVLKSKEHFYNPKLYLSSMNTINLALQICSLPYAPSKLEFSYYSNNLLTLDYDKIKYYVFDDSTNIFKPYFEKVLPEIINKNADYIGISINSSSQITAGLTLANMLKTRTNAHIDIGGNHFGRVTDALEKYPEFFELFCHSLIAEEGEAPVLQLAKHIEGKISIEEVPNLYYLKDGKVVSNPKTEPLKLNDLEPPCLDGYKLEDYFAPDIIMPFPSSAGCYWRKCSFCDHDFGRFYNTKKIDKLIEEIKYLKEKYNISKYEFIDEAISPAYMKAMSERLIEENLNIDFFCDARIESEFTEDVLQTARKAGLRMVLWGFESGSKRIMDLINKGIDVDNRLNVLRKAHDAGIYNFAFIFFGFPAETKEEAMETIDVICKNTDIINSYGKSIFTMGKHTKLRETPEKYGVIGETKQESEFSPTYLYTAKGMSKDELKEIVAKCTECAHEAYGNSLSFHLLSREIIFLYLVKYGLKEVCNFKFEE